MSTYGAGKIEQLPSGRWRVRIPNGSGGYDTLGAYDDKPEAIRMRAAAVVARQRVVAYDTVERYGDRVIEGWRRAGKRSADVDASRWQTWVVARADWAREPVGCVVRSQVRDWARGLLDAITTRGKPASEQTIKHALVLVRCVFAEAVRDELIPSNPADDVDAPTRNTPKEDSWAALSDAEIDHALCCGWLRQDQRAAIALACFTGLRQGELAALRWDDVRDLNGASPHLIVRRSWGTTPKNGRTRRVDLIPRAAEWLATLQRGDGCVWGVEHATGYDWGWSDTTDLTRDVTWLGVRRRLGISRTVTWHHLRDTCASHLLTGTWGRAWTIAEVAALLGHSSTWVTERYGRMIPGALASAAAATVHAATMNRPRGPVSWQAMCGSNARPLAPEANANAENKAVFEARGRFVADVVLQTVAAGRPLSESLVAELVALTLGREDVRLAQRLAAGEGPRVMLAVRLAEALDADVGVHVKSKTQGA